MAPKKNLSDTERNLIVQWILANSKDGKPLWGKIQEAGVKFGSSRRNVTRLRADAKRQIANGEAIHLASKKSNATRRKMVQIDLELIQSLDLSKRATVRKLAGGINCSKSTVWRWVNKGFIKPHTSALSADHKLLRLKFSIEALEFDRVLNILKFKSMYNTVHIDEKCFYLTKKAHRYYLTPEEEEPHRSCKSKHFIPKVMFMCAVCRPIFDDAGSVVFDGKIGIFPFTQLVVAVRASKNRPAGTLEVKSIQAITKEVIKACLINQILPAIRAKWPRCASRLIFIQQDNTRPHINDNDVDFRAAASLEGFDIHLVHQPPMSPDTNVNDLGWFRALQSIQTQYVCNTVEDLVNAVIQSFVELSPITLNKVFLSLQSCMIKIMKVKGHNSYKIPHLKKDVLLRQETLPIDLEVPTRSVQECIAFMLENGCGAQTEMQQERLGLLIEDWTEGR